MPENADATKLIEGAELDLMQYNNRWGRYMIRIDREDMVKQKDSIVQLFKMAAGK